MFLARLVMSMVGGSSSTEESTPAHIAENKAKLARIVTAQYTRKQELKYQKIKEMRSASDTQFRALLDVLSLCASTQYLTDSPSSRAPNSHPGSPCSFPGSWDFDYDGHKYYWRDVHHELGSAVLWSSPTVEHIVIAVKDSGNSGFASNYLMNRTQGRYFNGTYIQPAIYREAASLFESLESTGFLGVLRPWAKGETNTGTRNLNEVKRDFGFLLTGHKTGGAVATVLGMILVERGYLVREVITFGAPKFMNESATVFWNSKLRLTRVVNEGDLTHLTPLSALKSPFSDNWAHFGREVVLRRNGTHTEENSNGMADSLVHQLLLKGPSPLYEYWYTNGATGDIHHPILTLDPEFTGHPSADDFTDALLFCMYRMQNSKKLRNQRSGRPLGHKSDSARTHKPSLWYLALLLLIRTVLFVVNALVGVHGNPEASAEEDSEPLTPLSPSLAKDVNFKRLNAVSAYTTIYQDNILQGNARAPSTLVNGSKSPVEKLYEEIDHYDSDHRCADCVLFRRRNFAKKQFGALVVHPSKIHKVKMAKKRAAAASQTKKIAEIGSTGNETVSRKLKKDTEEALMRSQQSKGKIRKANPYLPTQRDPIRDWANQDPTLLY